MEAYFLTGNRNTDNFWRCHNNNNKVVVECSTINSSSTKDSRASLAKFKDTALNSTSPYRNAPEIPNLSAKTVVCMWSDICIPASIISQATASTEWTAISPTTSGVKSWGLSPARTPARSCTMKITVPKAVNVNFHTISNSTLAITTLWASADSRMRTAATPTPPSSKRRLFVFSTWWKAARTSPKTAQTLTSRRTPPNTSRIKAPSECSLNDSVWHPKN